MATNNKLAKTLLNYKLIARILGFLLLIMGAAMIPSIICAHIYGEFKCFQALLITNSQCLFWGAILVIAMRSERSKFRTREGYIVVASCWVIASFIGSFPYMLSGFAPNFWDALFESTAGFTTTGCTAFNFDIMPNSLVLWKATGNWLGGMGILVFVISILPALGINGQFIVRAEAPGPVFEKISVRMSDTAKTLYLSYFSLSIIEFLLLLLGSDMPAFDALINTMGSISTGGVAIYADGIMHYDSLFVELVISIFTILASVNFLLYHYAASGKWRYVLKDIELRYFMGLIAGGTLICTLAQYFSGTTSSIGSALRASFFQITSISTTSGYVGSDYCTWPPICSAIIILLMFIGGCAASTSGSVKVIRVMTLMKMVRRAFTKKMHPRQVVAIKVGEKATPAHVVSEITVFILLYALVFLVGSLLLALQNMDMETTLSTTLAMLSNTGIGLGEGANIGNYSMFSNGLKPVLCMLMIIGRLEMFPIIILFTRNFWGKDR